MDSRLLNFIVCPRDHTELRIEGSHLYCAAGHNYPIVDGIPVFLLAEKDQTIGIASASLRAAETAVGGPLYIDTLGLSSDEKRGIEKDWTAGGKIDPAVSYLIGATSGWGYVNLIGKLGHYPIPNIPSRGWRRRTSAGHRLELGSLVGFSRSQRLEGYRN